MAREQAAQAAAVAATTELAVSQQSVSVLLAEKDNLNQALISKQSELDRFAGI